MFNWGALLLITNINIVNTNIVLLCEWLSQEFPVFGLLKVIVLYCIVVAACVMSWLLSLLV